MNPYFLRTNIVRGISEVKKSKFIFLRTMKIMKEALIHIKINKLNIRKITKDQKKVEEDKKIKLKYKRKRLRKKKKEKRKKEEVKEEFK